MPTIVLHVEDKVSTDLLVLFRILTSVYVFVGIILALLIYFQLNSVSPFVITIVLIHAYSMIVITIVRDLIPTLVFWGVL